VVRCFIALFQFLFCLISEISPNEKSIDEIYDTKKLKPIIKHFDQLVKENKAARKVIKKFEIKFWPPKISIEWEFPFREKK